MTHLPHHFKDWVSVEVDQQRRITWGINVEGAGFADQNIKPNSMLTVKSHILGNKTKSEILLETGTNRPAKGKYFVVVVNVACEDRANPLNPGNVNPSLKHFLFKHATLIGPNTVIHPYADFSPSKDILPLDHQRPPGNGDFEIAFYFDVPVDTKELSLVIDAPERINDQINAQANHKAEIQPHVPIIDLEQTDNFAGYAGPVEQKSMEMFNIGMSGRAIYVSKAIAEEIKTANAADKAKEDQQQQESEKKRQKKLEEKF
jgi:hypothetical protein